MIAPKGIASVQFSFVTPGAGSSLSLSYNSSTQQVLLTSSDSAIFASPLFSAPVVFQMRVTDAAAQCVTSYAPAVYNAGCTSAFEVSMQALTVLNCPSDIHVLLSNPSFASQYVIWNEPDLVAEYSFLSVARPGSQFPIGKTNVLYTIDENVQSEIQSAASQVFCQFGVC